MKLNRETKHSVKPGDVLRFSYGDSYIIKTVINGNRGNVNYTLLDVRNGRTIYSIPSSSLYGAEIISSAQD